MAQDNFNRADGDPGANWTVCGATTSKPVISGNQLVNYTNPGRDFMYYNVSQPTNDQYTRFKHVGTLDDTYCLVRVQSGETESCYGVSFYNNAGTHTIWFGVFDAWPAAPTELTPEYTGFTVSDGDILEVRAIGNVISAYQNGILLTSRTDASNTHPTGYVGLGSYGATTVQDDWEGGNFPPPFITDARIMFISRSDGTSE